MKIALPGTGLHTLGLTATRMSALRSPTSIPITAPEVLNLLQNTVNTSTGRFALAATAKAKSHQECDIELLREQRQQDRDHRNADGSKLGRPYLLILLRFPFPDDMAVEVVCKRRCRGEHRQQRLESLQMRPPRRRRTEIRRQRALARSGAAILPAAFTCTMALSPTNAAAPKPRKSVMI